MVEEDFAASRPDAPRQDGAELHGGLTPSDLIRLDYIAVPPGLADHITTFYYFRCDEAEIRDYQPAAVGQLSIFLRGEGHIHFANGKIDPSHRDVLLGPGSAAARIEVAGPFHAVGAALTPLGFAALTGLDAGRHSDRLEKASDRFGPEIAEIAEELSAGYVAGSVDAEAIVAALAAFIEPRLKPVPHEHRELIACVNSWLAASLTPATEGLYASSPYSERQTQRLTERYFGLPPKALARKYRALRAAMYFSLPHLPEAAEAELAEAFSDQSHMIREIRHFVGRTPARLADPDAPILHELISPDNFRELGGGIAGSAE